MKFMNIAKNYAPRINHVKAVAGAGLFALATAVNAAVPQEVTNALSEAKADSLQVGGIVLGIIVAIFALFMMRRVLK